MAGSSERKVVCIVTSAHPSTDPRIFLKQAQSLVRAGYVVRLVAQHSRDEMVGDVGVRALHRPRSRLTRVLNLNWRAFRSALRERADVYHFHDPELIPWMLLLRLLRRVPIVYDVHEDYVTSVMQKGYLPKPARRPLAWVVRVLERVASRSFGVVLAERYYAERFPMGVTVLNYPLVPESPSQKATGLACIGTQRVLYTGNITEDRGALVHAGLVHLFPDMHVYLVGRCSSRMADQVRGISSPHEGRVHVEGEGNYVPHERIWAYYSVGGWVAGLALFPPTEHYRRKELTKLFEYMAAGMPIIASDFPNWKAIVEGKRCGLTVDPLDPDAIARAFAYLLDNPEEARLMGDNGRRAVEEEYNWQHEEKKLLALYETLFGSSGNGPRAMLRGCDQRRGQ